jgi:hypothetical protein
MYDLSKYRLIHLDDLVCVGKDCDDGYVLSVQ